MVLINGNASTDTRATLPEAGTYRLVIHGNGATTGSYGFRLSDAATAPTVSGPIA